MSMIKIVEAGSWTGAGFDNPASLIKVSSRGLIGNDRADFLKIASHVFADAIDNVSLRPGDVPIHLNAIGATEGFGCFVAGTEVRCGNGELVPIDHLSLAQHVVDRNGRPGKVVTTYEQPYDGDGIRLGISGLLDPINCTANHTFFTIPASQVACLIDKEKHCKPGTCQRNKICSERNCARAFPSYSPEELAAESLRPGDYVLCPVPDRGIGQQTWAWSDAMSAVFGYWLAEGSFIKRRAGEGTRCGLQFSFGTHESETVCHDFEEAAKNLCSEYDGLRLAGPWRNEDDNTIAYTLRGCPTLADRFYRAGGEYSQHKRLGGEVYSQSPARIGRMIAAYIDGDGTCPHYRRKDCEYIEARYSATTASRRLALDLQWILSRLGVAACVQKVDFISDMTGEPSTHYRCSFNNVSGEWLRRSSRKHASVPPRQYKEHSFLWNGFICRPVRSTETFHLQDYVYNLEVLDDHSYTVGNGVAVRNCNRNGDGFAESYCKAAHQRFVSDSRYYRNHQNKKPEKSYGSVKLSAYNDDMRRIELLLLGNGTEKAAERNGGLPMLKASVDKLERGESIPFSMATKIAFDVCSNCHNKAANRRQYCDELSCISESGRRGFGCKHGLTKVAADGFQQYVENPDPYFFDISEVVRPADRIAYGGLADYMQKAASDRVVGGAELAELWSGDGADFGVLTPEATIFNRHVVSQIKLAHELSALESDNFVTQTPNIRQLSAAFSPSLYRFGDPGLLGAPGSEKLASYLAAMAEQKMLLPLPAFIHIATGGDAEKIASLSASVPRHLPGVFSRLLADPALETQIRSNKFAHSLHAVTADKREVVVKQAAACSLDPDCVRDRVWRATINGAPSAVVMEKGSMIKTATTDDPSESVARQYAMYKLAFLAAVPRDAHFPQLKQAVVGQNYLEVSINVN